MHSYTFICTLLAVAATAVVATPVESSTPSATAATAPATASLFYGTRLTANEASAALANATSVVPLTLAALDKRDTSAEPVTKRSYVATCRRCSVYSEYWLQCECREGAQGSQRYYCSNLNLNNCIENKDGVLQWKASGNFAGSCGSWWVVGSLYGTSCTKNNGASNPTTIQLDERIHNSNGFLFCAP